MLATVPAGRVAVKRFVGVVIALILPPAGTAAAQEGAPDLDIKENPARVKADGPGFTVKLSKQDLKVRIDDERFGIPEAGFDVERNQQDLGPIGQNLRPFVCENGTYRVVSGIFDTTERSSSTELRPLPYPPAFGNAFPTIITFVGTLDAVLTNANGERLRLLMSDLARGHDAHHVLRDCADPRLHRRLRGPRPRPRVSGRPGQYRSHDGPRRPQHRRRGHVPSDGHPAGQPWRDGLRAVLRAPVPNDGDQALGTSGAWPAAISTDVGAAQLPMARRWDTRSSARPDRRCGRCKVSVKR
jgi:hypothetical protein